MTMYNGLYRKIVGIVSHYKEPFQYWSRKNMNELKAKQSVRTALLLYAIFMGISGIIMFSVFLLWVIPKEQIPIVIVPLSAMALFLFGSCLIALILRMKFFRKEAISNDQ